MTTVASHMTNVAVKVLMINNEGVTKWNNEWKYEYVMKRAY